MTAAAFDSSKIKTWYKAVTKTTTEQLHWAKETLSGKPPPIPNDSLEKERKEVDYFYRVCEAVLQDVEKLASVLDVLKGKEITAVGILSAVTLTEYECPKDLETCIETYSNAHIKMTTEIDGKMESIKMLMTTVKNKLHEIQSVKKKFETREKLHLRMTEEDKKWHRARESGDVKVMERRQKADRAVEDYDYITSETREVSSQLTSLRNEFLKETFNSLSALEASTFHAFSGIFNNVQRNNNPEEADLNNLNTLFSKQQSGLNEVSDSSALPLSVPQTKYSLEETARSMNMQKDVRRSLYFNKAPLVSSPFRKTQSTVTISSNTQQPKTNDKLSHSQVPSTDSFLDTFGIVQRRPPDFVLDHLDTQEIDLM